MPNPDLKLLPGMTADISFQVGEVKDVLRIPNAALRFFPLREHVHPDDHKLLDSGTAARRPTTIRTRGEQCRRIGRGAEAAKQAARLGIGRRTAPRHPRGDRAQRQQIHRTRVRRGERRHEAGHGDSAEELEHDSVAFSIRRLAGQRNRSTDFTDSTDKKRVLDF